jgi:probable F420-dependent oxidoreductase
VPGKAFRFGVVASHTSTPQEWRDLAKEAEDLGYSTLLVPDHFNEQFGALTALTVAAEATKSLRLSTSVLDNDFRHPATLAKEIATLDVFSGGRVELGLGAGWQNSDYDRTGMKFDLPGVRFERLREAVAVYRGLFDAGPFRPFSFDGTHYQIRDYDALPKPVQRPLPIMLGAGGPRMLRLAAREADIINYVPRALPQGGMDFSDTSAEAFARKAAKVRGAAGDRLAALEIGMLVHLVVVSDAASEIEAAQQQGVARFQVEPQDVSKVPVALAGSVAQVVDELRLRRELYGLTYISVLSRNLNSFAPVVAALSGRTD